MPHIIFKMMTSWGVLLSFVLAGILLLAPSGAAGAQMDGPKIVEPSEKEIILQSGQNYSLICKGKRPLQFRQQEVFEEGTGNFKMIESHKTLLDNEYEVALNLYNVDQFAVGFYACFDETVDEADVLTDIVEEPNNTEHVSYVYIYVNGSNKIAPMRTLVVPIKNTKFLIECRPTTPDIEVKLTTVIADEHISYNPKIGFTFDRNELIEVMLICAFIRDKDDDDHIEIFAQKYVVVQPPQPKIEGGSRYFMKDNTFSVNCSVRKIKNSPVELKWKIPGKLSKVLVTSNEFSVTDENPILYKTYTIQNASENDAGDYVCISKNIYNSSTAKFKKIYLDESHIIFLSLPKPDNVVNIDKMAFIRLNFQISAYPKPKIIMYKDGQALNNSSKYIISMTKGPDIYSVTFKVTNLALTDIGTYSLVAENDYVSNTTKFTLRVEVAPVVDLGTNIKRVDIDTTVSVNCIATGYPLPEVEWYIEDKRIQHAYEIEDSLYQITSNIQIEGIHDSGNITCRAKNPLGSDNGTVTLIVYEMPGGLGIKNADETWFAEGEDVVLQCLASKYDFINVSWFTDEAEIKYVNYTENKLSHMSKLRMEHITTNQAGNYTCIGFLNNGSSVGQTVFISVAEKKMAEIKDPEDQYEEVLPYQPVNLTCIADAVPPPLIEWYKDSTLIRNNTNININKSMLNHSTISSTINIALMQDENAGTYECKVTTGDSIVNKLYNVVMKEKPTNITNYLAVMGVVSLIFIVSVAYLTWKIRKERVFRKQLQEAGLLYFKDGVPKSINPELGIDEQAELLPYNEKFEFPAEKLHLGKQLGAGAFGVVYKAEARGIINAEQSTVVAVKTVKRTADNMYIKALASELKIMVHLGKHINIVNLLGACTKNIVKRELMVIVEYCKFGNIHNYLLKHRNVFKNTLTDYQESMGQVNRGYTNSNGNSRMQSDYYGSDHTQQTDNTFINSANTNRSGKEDGYIQPQWRSNYESDYCYDGLSPRPLFSRDLLTWAFQIARGMEYLVSRKVLHGDLAARNVLLADDNIVKICDFGLAKSIYKDKEYQKKENSPLPVKWLAIECMTDGIFSTQSDVWSFGVVLWELFTLAKTPYPDINPTQMLRYLSEGNRLDKPMYADEKLYDVMKRCWHEKPPMRPSFTELQEILGSFLEDTMRQHYVDLNETYIRMNLQHQPAEDYLAMVNAPDYNNLVTPGPHDYVNVSTGLLTPNTAQLQHDNEGYLQMSPASKLNHKARVPSTKFDFDERKVNVRMTEPNNYGSELTPMLTLNNLPRSGSESDHEGSSPFPNNIPPIETEADEVIESTFIAERNTNNIDNPIYGVIIEEKEKKSQNFSNNYINVPNGLVI